MREVLLEQAVHERLLRYGYSGESEQEVIQRLIRLADEYLVFLHTHKDCVQASELLSQKRFKHQRFLSEYDLP